MAAFSASYAVLVFPSAFVSVWDGPADSEEILYKVLSIAKAITSSLAFTLGGLGLVALGLAQWRAGNQLRVAGIANFVMGLTTLFIWVEISVRLGGISNHDSFLDVAKPLSWLLGFIVCSWWAITGLLLILGMWKSSRQNKISIP